MNIKIFSKMEYIPITYSRGMVESVPELTYIAVSAICGFFAGIYSNRRRFQAFCSVVLAFANEAREYYRIKADGKITDIEAQELAATVDAFFVAVERLGVEMKQKP